MEQQHEKLIVGNIFTWYVVVRGLDACREVGVFRYGVGVVVKRWQLGQDLRVSWHKDWRKDYTRASSETTGQC